MEELWRRIKEHQGMSSQLLATKLVVRFHYKDPDGMVTVDGSDGNEIRVHTGACDIQPVIELSMKSDTAHNFWLGKENPVMALISGRIASKGPVNRALALLPVVKPAFDIYPGVVDDLNKL
jgi:hypothetical protein